jgi:hypothetical protein
MIWGIKKRIPEYSEEESKAPLLDRRDEISIEHHLCTKKERTPEAYEFTSLLVYRPRPKENKLNPLSRLRTSL